MSAFRRLKAYFGMVPAEELDEYPGEDYEPDYEPSYRSERAASPRSSRWAADDEPEDRAPTRETPRSEPTYRDESAQIPSRPMPPRRSWSSDTPVRGSLAVDPVRDVAARSASLPAEDAHPLSRITTLHPRNYNEARSIGEHYRDGIPVIMNLTEMEDADAKRLVDFAAGLAFALRGSIEKVTTKVFLISPANIDVTAEDRRRIAEGSFFAQH